MVNRLIFLSLLFIAFNVHAMFDPAQPFYTDQPDKEAIQLGMGNYADLGYSVVYYVCPDGNNANPGTSPDAPLQTLWSNEDGSGGMSQFASLPADGVIAFCRGGIFRTNIDGKIANLNASKEQPVTIRDYQKPNGSTKPPEIFGLFTTASASIFYFFSSNNVAEEGYIVKNLKLTAGNQGYGRAFTIYNDTDFVTIANNDITGFNAGIVSNAHGAGVIRFVATVYDDLIFTDNASGLDTISKTTNWDTSIKRGDFLRITNSISNNKDFRVDSVTGNTIYVTGTQSWAAMPDTTWDVTNESGTTGISVTILAGDGSNTGLRIEQNRFTLNGAAGFYGRLRNGSYLRNNEFILNGFQSSTLDHNIYFNDSTFSDITNNKLLAVGPYAGSGSCSAVSLVGHGINDNIHINDNFLYQPSDMSSAGCYGIAIDGGYSEYEKHSNFLIDGNYIANAGFVGIGCEACVDTVISNNVIECTKANSCRGIAVPNRNPTTTLPLDEVTANITITGNTIKALNATLKTTSGIFGISAGGSSVNAATSGAFTVTNNIIDGWYTCIYQGDGGATLTVTGNTTTNCGAGGGEQP